MGNTIRVQQDSNNKTEGLASDVWTDGASGRSTRASSVTHREKNGSLVHAAGTTRACSAFHAPACTHNNISTCRWHSRNTSSTSKWQVTRAPTPACTHTVAGPAGSMVTRPHECSTRRCGDPRSSKKYTFETYVDRRSSNTTQLHHVLPRDLLLEHPNETFVTYV